MEKFKAQVGSVIGHAYGRDIIFLSENSEIDQSDGSIIYSNTYAAIDDKNNQTIVYILKGQAEILAEDGTRIAQGLLKYILEKHQAITAKELYNLPWQAMSTEHPLIVPIGEDEKHEHVTMDIRKMPHLLVAGTTGSGKSVFLNTLILSMLYNNTERVKLTLIDPKWVEFSAYSELSILDEPIIHELPDALASLVRACEEMDSRYQKLANAGARNIESYNQINSDSALKYKVIIIDEFSDLMMMQENKELEQVIVRLAQKGRAAGIHLILTTQRPTVDVVTGLIKSNIPSRISFRVASGTDSRVILDQLGAEELLGKGDMLFKSVEENALRRLQAAFVSDEEIDEIVQQVRDVDTSAKQQKIKSYYQQKEEKIQAYYQEIEQKKVQNTLNTNEEQNKPTQKEDPKKVAHRYWVQYNNYRGTSTPKERKPAENDTQGEKEDWHDKYPELFRREEQESKRKTKINRLNNYTTREKTSFTFEEYKRLSCASLFVLMLAIPVTWVILTALHTSNEIIGSVVLFAISMVIIRALKPNNQKPRKPKGPF